MKKSKWVYPIITLVFSIIALALSLVLYIYWYLEVSDVLESVIARVNLDRHLVFEPQTWVVIMVLSILVGFILICIFTIFVYNQKTLQLYRLQNNFINNFTHELKTPVTSIKLYLETFLRHELSREDQARYTEFMIQDAERLSENINQILNLGKLESDVYSEERSPLDLLLITEKFIRENVHVFGKSVIKVHNQTRDSYIFNINFTMFEMLLMNLLTNAVKYNESEIPRVDIYFRKVRNKLVIQFQDNGIGIEKTELKKIFKKFYQTMPNRKNVIKGSGLGLYMAKSIVRSYGGRLKADSKEGREGSVFTVILPYPYSLNRIYAKPLQYGAGETATQR